MSRDPEPPVSPRTVTAEALVPGGPACPNCEVTHPWRDHGPIEELATSQDEPDAPAGELEQTR